MGACEEIEEETQSEIRKKEKKRKIRVVISTSINLIWGIVYVIVGKVYEDRDYTGYATSFLMVLENQI